MQPDDRALYLSSDYNCHCRRLMSPVTAFLVTWFPTPTHWTHSERIEKPCWSNRYRKPINRGRSWTRSVAARGACIYALHLNWLASYAVCEQTTRMCARMHRLGRNVYYFILCMHVISTVFNSLAYSIINFWKTEAIAPRIDATRLHNI